MEEKFKIVVVLGDAAQFGTVAAYLTYTRKDPFIWFSNHVNKLKENDPLSIKYKTLTNLRFSVIEDNCERLELPHRLQNYSSVYQSTFGIYFKSRCDTVEEWEKLISTQEKRVETVKHKAQDRKAAGGAQSIDPYYIFQLEQRVAKLENDLTFFISNAQEVFKNLNARLDILEPSPVPPWLEK